MVDTILSVENVSKHYKLGVFGSGSLAEDLKQWSKRLLRKDAHCLEIEENASSIESKSGLVWALKDINFNVKRGDALGIIGANGAGKSTLLKLLSRVTKPSLGEIKYKGRLASLLEVGTGFHPELTGRENIFLNGGILGMPKSEIIKKLDEIIDFSGCRRYMDTPVKRYSSGMRVRLGFAVAAFLDPDILIVDEVLAVGDAEFQKRAIGKMQSVSTEEGRTVIFVSHNMATVSSVCNKGLLLANGKIKKEGSVEAVVNDYLVRKESTFDFNSIEGRKGNGKVRFKSAKVYSNRAEQNEKICTSGPFYIELLTENPERVIPDQVLIDLRIDSAIGNRLLWLSTSRVREWNFKNNSVVFFIKNLPLNEGVYVVTLYCKVNNDVSDWIKNAFSFKVENLDTKNSGKIVNPNQSPFVVEYDITT